ncbi:nicotinate-nucleotide adenylyltransferase [Massilia oculi]|uniref:Probable nicotinate-nucleotide adenylyltransferase n=1 Tax=Massilia oculi TaxID=945844 RepID=A0A2S2DL85_9BURK|nr:nicotinate-nucleotide adenylyltransferase [Massilia oculi]AWL06130.1 nicotinate-nicotinamide nucleotide adenylyltransferase [Massilia oculi]
MTGTRSAPGRNRCIAVLGGSFDPVHQGHVALARLFAGLLRPDALRILPAGQPWQKNGLQASDRDRVAMLELAFEALKSPSLPVTIDLQEIERNTPTYTVETLRALRQELGPRTSIVFLMGADQLRKLDSWNEWRELFALANLGVATRPGYDLAQEALPPMVAQELSTRLATPDTVRLLAHGKVCLAPTLDVDLSSSQLRAALQSGADASALGMAQVLDYIQQHNLYKN